MSFYFTTGRKTKLLAVNRGEYFSFFGKTKVYRVMSKNNGIVRYKNQLGKIFKLDCRIDYFKYNYDIVFKYKTNQKN